MLSNCLFLRRALPTSCNSFYLQSPHFSKLSYFFSSYPTHFSIPPPFVTCSTLQPFIHSLFLPDSLCYLFFITLSDILFVCHFLHFMFYHAHSLPSFYSVSVNFHFLFFFSLLQSASFSSLSLARPPPLLFFSCNIFYLLCFFLNHFFHICSFYFPPVCKQILFPLLSLIFPSAHASQSLVPDTRLFPLHLFLFFLLPFTFGLLPSSPPPALSPPLFLFSTLSSPWPPSVILPTYPSLPPPPPAPLSISQRCSQHPIHFFLWRQELTVQFCLALLPTTSLPLSLFLPFISVPFLCLHS